MLAVQNQTCTMQRSGAEDEAEQVLDVLMSKGATEAALADEMGRLRVQEEVTCSVHLLCCAADLILNVAAVCCQAPRL